MANEIRNQVALLKEDKAELLKTLRDHTSRKTYITDIITHIISKAKVADADFNSNPFLLGFLNGVYDLRTAEFREYRYDDYITLTTRYDYKPVDYTDEETIKMATILAEIIHTIQPNEEHRNLLLVSLASGLDGRAYQKIFMFNGQGGNGKGLIGSLMDIILGDYYHQPSNGILKDIEKANTPSPDMINLKNKRYINFKEVSGKIKAAMLRNLTGGGKFSGRYLNQNPEQFYMSGTFVMEFNTDPELDGQPQRADYRRMVNLFFPTNFTDDEMKIGKTFGEITFQKANTYYETNEFLEKSKYLFLDLLLNVYKENRDTESDKGLIINIPQSIRNRTEKFLENQNVFHKLFNRYWKTSTSTEKVQVKIIWESIKESGDYKDLSYEQKKTYGRDAFYKYLETIFSISGNTKTGKLICGVERKEEQNDIDNSDDEDCDTDTEP
jgi:phage/plasmid-associated DNA primase